MQRALKKFVATVTLVAGMGMVIAFGFWSLRANAYVRSSFNSPTIVRVAVGVSDTNAPGVNVVAIASSVTNQSPKPVLAAPVKVEAAVAPAVPAPQPHKGILTRDRQFALGMIETANDDSEIGSAGEVSRFQIMPSVWHRYSPSRQYRNLDVSREVARQHWLSLYRYFKREAGREPTDFDMYVLWNTSHGYYANRKWQPGRLGPVVRDRAKRFANLVERGNT